MLLRTKFSRSHPSLKVIHFQGPGCPASALSFLPAPKQQPTARLHPPNTVQTPQKALPSHKGGKGGLWP
jgi:hypothetical protein